MNGLKPSSRILITQNKYLGAKTGLHQETISLIENGHSAARIETLLAILAALDLEFQVAPRTKSRQWPLEEEERGS